MSQAAGPIDADWHRINSHDTAVAVKLDLTGKARQARLLGEWLQMEPGDRHRPVHGAVASAQDAHIAQQCLGMRLLQEHAESIGKAVAQRYDRCQRREVKLRSRQTKSQARVDHQVVQVRYFSGAGNV